MREVKKCNIIQDLLLNYKDKDTNSDTKQFIEKHIVKCKTCQEKLKNMGEDKLLNMFQEKREKNHMRNKKIRNWSILAILAVIIVIIVTISIDFFNAHEIIIGKNGEPDYIESFKEWMNKKLNPREKTNISNIIVKISSKDSDDPQKIINSTLIFTFDDKKDICLGDRYLVEGLTMEELNEKYGDLFNEEYGNLPAMIKAKIENEKLICSINRWTGMPKQEVIDYIYKNYSQNTIIKL